jgi:hypothetical protein
MMNPDVEKNITFTPYTLPTSKFFDEYLPLTLEAGAAKSN